MIYPFMALRQKESNFQYYEFQSQSKNQTKLNQSKHTRRALLALSQPPFLSTPRRMVFQESAFCKEITHFQEKSPINNPEKQKQ